ncbi:MAG: hypothetical protein JSR46_01520 [Verrucomicrobia bacterium]|nr:hypothetical protein [Verrucomicrobiota bacterium]
MKVLSKHASYGHFPEATCKLSELKKYAHRLMFLEKLFKKCKREAETRDHHLVKKIASGRAKKVKHHPTYAYLDNRVGNLNASHVKIGKEVDFLLAGSPFKSKKAIRDHLYHALIATDCTLWFTLNECHDRPKFWDKHCLKKIKLPKHWKITNVKEKTVAKRGHSKLIKSTLWATNGIEAKKIIHYHYANWPDHKPAPSEKLLLKCAKIAAKHMETTKTAVGINCKAGVGRTGILANLIYGMQYIKKKMDRGKSPKKISINPAELNYDLRRGRKGMVSHPAQFAQVWKALSHYAASLHK